MKGFQLKTPSIARRFFIPKNTLRNYSKATLFKIGFPNNAEHPMQPYSQCLR